MADGSRRLLREHSKDLKRFQAFLRDRIPTGPAGDVASASIHVPHRGLRPVEFFLQHRLVLHPLVAGSRYRHKVLAEFGSDVGLLALLTCAEASSNGDRSGIGNVAELLMLDVPTAEFQQVASDAVRSWLADNQPGSTTAFVPSTLSFVNLLSVGSFGEPTDELLDETVGWFQAYIDSRTDERNPIAVAVGSLLWRALDAGRIGRTAMYDLVHAEPDLLRILESDSFYAGTRVSASVPPGSPSEELVEQVCLERLGSFGSARAEHMWGGPIKSISLWPGTPVLLQALDRFEEIRQLSRDEFQDSPASSLWHILRHTRRAAGKPIDRTRLDRYSERTLVQAAMVAPWYSADIEPAVELPGLTDIVAWTYAHSQSVMGSSDPSQDLPRVQRQIAAVLEDRGLLGQVERDEGVFERDWLLSAIDRIGESNLPVVLQAIHLAFRHKAYLSEAVEAVLGRNSDEVWTAVREQKQLFVRMLGLLPQTPGSVDERLQWLATFAADAESSSAQKRLMERRAAFTGATNLAWTDGVADAMLLAWHHNHPGVMGDRIEVPLTFERHRVRLGSDANGDPTLEVVKRGQRERPLKGIPREIAAQPDFQQLRKTIRDLEPFLAAFRATCERRLLMGYELRPAMLRLLLEHPVMGPMIRTCVFTDGETDGFPVLEGQSVRLEDEDGGLQTVRRNANLTMAHPLELLEDETLETWRDLLVKRGWTQPVPQLFREIPQPHLRGAAQRTNEYADREVSMAPAVELLRTSGWSVGAGQHPRRYYPDSELIACWPFNGRVAADLLRYSVATTGPLSFIDAETREVVPLADVPDFVLSDAARDCARVIAWCSAPGDPPPLPVINARYAFLQRLIAREEADATTHPHEPGVITEVTRDRLTLRIRVPRNGGKKKKKGKKKTTTTADGDDTPPAPLPVATVRIDLMTGETRVGDDDELLALSLFDEPAASGSFSQAPEPSLDQVVRAWSGIRAGIDAGDTELLRRLS